MANARRVNSSIFDRTNGANTGFSQRLTGGTNEKYGIARTIKVMPGDTVKMEVFAKYVDRNQANWTSGFQTLMNSIAAASPTGGVVVDGSSYSTSTSSFPFPSQHSFADRTSGTTPRAFLNYISFDDNWNPILLDNSQTNFVRLSSIPIERGQDVAHERMAASFIVKQPGYVYIYLSNDETTPLEVFFDDFNVTHAKGPVVQSQDYYPFGLTFNSYNRENTPAQNYLYNGKEKQDELDLGWLDYGARMYEPEIGRWNGIDALADDFVPLSPFVYVANNPVVQIDPDGRGVVFANSESEKQYNRIYESADDKTKAKLDQLRTSDVKYNINVSGDLQDEGASTLYNFQTNAVDINVNTAGHENDVVAMLADELTHASQFENGEIGFIESGGSAATVGYDIEDEVNSKLGAMNAVESVNKAEGTDIKLTGTTKRFADAYNAAPEDKKQEAAEKFFKTDKVGKQYMQEFSEKKMGKQSNIPSEITSYEKQGYDVSNYAYRSNGETKKKK